MPAMLPLPAAPDLAPLPLPLAGRLVPAGFPSPADDYLEGEVDLNRYLIERPAACYLMRVSGSSMSGRGIMDGDLGGRGPQRRGQARPRRGRRSWAAR
jgi:DNA polymerase V